MKGQGVDISISNLQLKDLPKSNMCMGMVSVFRICSKMSSVSVSMLLYIRKQGRQGKSNGQRKVVEG